MTPKDIEMLWQKLADKLNACGDGPTRDIDGWKKVFTEWKSQVRKKARESKPLNELENHVLTATGKIVVEGIATASDKLLQAYIETTDSQKEGLGEVAAGLNAIAKEKIKTRTTQEQYGVYLSFLGKYQYKPDIPEDEFSKMCCLLNTCTGPTHDAQQWKQVFKEWTSKIKITARNIYTHRLRTGGAMLTNNVLTDLENKLLYLINIIVIISMQIPELGLTKSTKPNCKTSLLATKKIKHLKGINKRNRNLKVYRTALAVYAKSAPDIHKLFKSCVDVLSACERLLNLLIAK
ncbi:hypothetical protein RN001_001547 [Aquatica leii]|uniref:Regulatory protein zeste n=1 Tax=Aquatica leii TaxID=1421715 RepID=A0AAN7PNQ3_9COLE|nr:hypothetical protein RN001_001547 [Aquatica leii]